MATKADGIEVSIESTAVKANAELDKLIARLSVVSDSLRSISGTTIGGVNSSTKLALNNLKSYGVSARKATKSTKSLAASFGKFYASYFLVIRGVKSLGKAIESTMDYIETYNYYNVIMDKIGAEFGSAWKENGYNSADEYAKSFKQRLNDLTGEMTGYRIGSEGGLYATDSIGLGLDPEKLMSFQAEVSSITNAVGLIGETSVNTSKALTMLSADLSSLKNQDLQSVMANLRSGLIGQSRALYKYGIDITNNTLAEYALANGIKKKVSEMTQAEKMQLRMIAILDQSKVAYGDMANTINGVANQYRVFKQQISNLARTIGALFIPVLQKVLPYINGFVIALQRLFTWIGNLMGVKWDGLMDGISSGYNDTGLDALGDSADDTTDALNDANKAAKKLKATIHGYDELHVATDPTSGSSSSGNTSGGGFDLSGAIGDALGDYQSVWDEAMKNMENRAKEFADYLTDIFKNKKFFQFGKDIGDSIKGALESIDWQDVFNAAYAFGVHLADFLNGLISPELFSDVGMTIANSLNTAIKAALGFGKEFDFENLGESIAEGINEFFRTFDFKALANTIDVWVQGIRDTIKELIDNVDWGSVWDGIKDFLSEIDIETVSLIVSAFAIKAASGAVKSLLLASLATSIGGVAAGAGISLAIAMTAVVTWSFVNDAVDWIGNLQEYGWDEGRKKSADKESNPYRNGVASVQENGSGGWNKIIDDRIEKQEEYNKKTEAQWNENKAKFDEWTDGISTKWSEFKVGISEKWDGIGTWFNENVAPWFTTEKWSTLWGNVKTAFSTKWSEIVTWWKGTAIYKWWTEDVAPWFTEKKWSDLYESIKKGLSKKWDEVVAWWKSTGAYKWYEDNVKPLFEEKKWSFPGIKDGLFSIFNSAIEAVKGLWNKFATWLNEKLTFNLDTSTLIGKGISNLLGTSTIKLANLPTFATGGFPEDGLFMANRNELVGQFSNGRTAVANNAQITDGIRAAVVDGMMEAFMVTQGNGNGNQSNNQPLQMVLDGRVIAEITYNQFAVMARQGLIPKFA